MKIAIDCRLIGSSGIGTFIENIVSIIVKEREHEFVLIGHPKNLKAYHDLSNCTIIPCNYRSFSLKELLLFPTKIVNRCDAFYTPNFNIPRMIKIPVFSTIHDIVFFDTPHFTNPIKEAIIRAYMKRALRISKELFTVSEFSRSRILQYFHSNRDLHVIYNGINRKLIDFKRNAPTKKKEHSIVYLGNLKRHKGIQILLDAYEKLKSSNVQWTLTIIGRFNFRTRDDALIKILESMKGNINLVTDADDTTVYQLISEASVLVSPSLYEGFGIPPLEALYLNTPVIISDIPVYKEVYHELPVTFFRAGDSNDLYQKLNTGFLTSPNCADFIDKHYNYKLTALNLLAIIKAAAIKQT